MNSMLSIKGLHFSYQNNPILRGIDLDIPSGSIFGYLGKNGAGKSTTIKLLLGLLPIDEGEIFFKGVSLKKSPLLLRSHASSMIEHPSFYSFLTVSENLDYLNKIFKMGKCRKQEVLSLLGLSEHANKKAQALSSGLKQRLGLAMCLFKRPEMLILDEPLNALDPQGIYELRLILRQLNEEEGVTIFLSSHILEELEKLANQVAIIDGGKVLYQGDIDGLTKKHSDVISLKVDNTDRIIQLNYASIFSVKQVDAPNHVEFEVRDEEEFSRLISSLSKDGISIYNITHKGSALENAFIHLTK
ncbi:ABC transporter ATP-binding protein [Porphyromonas macacae]|uniref:Daunorubicin/doxorubicin resistance ATP-binding protein DrrA n=1 Tax=Porphyromonas macacae TaxID=28115 RepID=A0A379DGG0_9PORP|nr:ABC transporter ATP-binding protein [Porphyromonas macacae]SUB77044.1 Daunorubicin/doxorubicin resistance ATP-binding protein DrrA [Porphyromonas macacae]